MCHNKANVQCLWIQIQKTEYNSYGCTMAMDHYGYGHSIGTTRLWVQTCCEYRYAMAAGDLAVGFAFRLFNLCQVQKRE